MGPEWERVWADVLPHVLHMASAAGAPVRTALQQAMQGLQTPVVVATLLQQRLRTRPMDAGALCLSGQDTHGLHPQDVMSALALTNPAVAKRLCAVPTKGVTLVKF